MPSPTRMVASSLAIYGRPGIGRMARRANAVDGGGDESGDHAKGTGLDGRLCRPQRTIGRDADGPVCQGPALGDGRNSRLVVVTLDLIEIPQTLRDLVVDMAGKNHGLKPEELLLNVSHTHGGPMVSNKTIADWGIDPAWGKRADDYVVFLVKQIDSVIRKALSSQVSATVGYTSARCGFAMNRRLPTAEGVRLAPNPDGPVDHDVPVLRIESAEKKLVGLVFGYACHNTALGPTRRLNGDYAGFAQRKLEEDHPDTVALFLSGCGGDQDPSPRRNDEDAVQNGLDLATAVESGLAAMPLLLDSSLSTSLEVCPLVFRGSCRRTGGQSQLARRLCRASALGAAPMAQPG